MNATNTRLNLTDATKILFVSGKGGVGKSLSAAAIAYREAKRGRRVLLVEIGESSYFKDYWQLSEVGYQPSNSGFGFDVALWNGEACLHEYVLFYLKVESLYRLFFANRVMKSLVNVAPGLSEIAILGKITSGIRHVGPSLNYDLLVIDSFATGHALSLLKAPSGLMEAIRFGPMGSHSRDIDAVLRNPKLTSYVATTLLEELPVTETLEFVAQIKKIFSADCAVIANKVMTPPITFEALQALRKRLTSDNPMTEFVEHISAVLKRQTELLKILQEKVNDIAQLPLVLNHDPKTVTRELGESLSVNSTLS